MERERATAAEDETWQIFLSDGGLKMKIKSREVKPPVVVISA